MKTIRKALRALDLLSEETPLIGVSEVSQRLNMPKSTTSRLLSSLNAIGLLELDPTTRRYGAGPAAARLGALYRVRVDPHQFIRQKMVELARVTGHSCWMGVLSGRDIVVLYNVHGSHPVRYVIEPGSHLPAHSTAMGRALLARLPDNEIREIYSGAGNASPAGRSSSNVPAILREAKATRARGWSEVRGDNFAGVGAIGCTIRGSLEHSTIGLSISYPLSSIERSHVQRLRDLLLESASWLGTRLGGNTQALPTTRRS